jgi:NDP-sugar pyrophosphorylase family protein
VLLDGTRVTGFAKRNTPEAAGSFHFIGVQAAAARVFRDVPERRAANSVGDVYDRLIANSPGSVRGFVSDASFMDIGTVADYVSTSRAIAGGLSRAIVWDGATVDPAAEVDDCIVTDGVHVPAGAKYHHAVLWRGPNGETVCDRWTDDRG